MADNIGDRGLGFQLQKITTEQFAVIREAFDSTDSDVKMSIGLKFGMDKANRFIVSFVKVQFEQKEKPFLLLEAGNHYKIEDTAWSTLQNSEGGIIVPKGFAGHLVMLTVGTLRGILHCKTENSEFNKFVLPTINVSSLIQSDIELV